MSLYCSPANPPPTAWIFFLKLKSFVFIPFRNATAVVTDELWWLKSHLPLLDCCGAWSLQNRRMIAGSQTSRLLYDWEFYIYPLPEMPLASITLWDLASISSNEAFLKYLEKISFLVFNATFVHTAFCCYLFKSFHHYFSMHSFIISTNIYRVFNMFIAMC